MTTQYDAWAFRVTFRRHGYTHSFLAGIYYFSRWRQWKGDGIPYPIGTALFDTRELARTAARAEGLHGRTVKVKVTVEEIV